MINKCRKPTHNLKALANFAGVELHKNKWLCKEQESILNIMTAFEGQMMHTQYSVDQYKIGLYFPKHKLAVECDEFGHLDRDIEYEVKRQKCTENELGYQFIQYNPDVKDFSIFKVINRVLLALLP